MLLWYTHSICLLVCPSFNGICILHSCEMLRSEDINMLPHALYNPSTVSAWECTGAEQGLPYQCTTKALTVPPTHYACTQVLRPSHRVEAVPSHIVSPTYQNVAAGFSGYRCCTLQVLLHISQRQ